MTTPQANRVARPGALPAVRAARYHPEVFIRDDPAALCENLVMHRLQLRGWLIGAILSLWFGVSVRSGLAQSAPEITGLAPLAGQPGVTTLFTVTGRHLQGVRELRTSVAGLPPWSRSTAVDADAGDRAAFECALPADVPPGLHAVRVAGVDGVSTQRLWLVDDLPTLAQAADNLSAEQAQTLMLPTAVEGTVGSLQRRYFRFEAREGQRIALEVYARRLGSALDPLVVLSNVGGRQLATADDTPGLGGDCQLVHHCATTGAYIVEVRDIRYRGGDEFPFHLRIGNFPCVQATYPLAVQRGTTAEISCVGLDPNDVRPTTVELPADDARTAVTLAAPGGEGQGSGLVACLTTDRPEVVEAEPNDSSDDAQRVTSEQNLNGRLQSAGDVDRYRYTVAAGERIVWRGATRELGTPTDLRLRLLNVEGRQIAAADDDGVREGVLDHKFESAGDYLLEVTDLLQRGGAAFAYRIEVQPYVPGFELSLEGDSLNVPAGGTAMLPVSVRRRGYDGEIELQVIGLPDGCVAAVSRIGPGQNLGRVTVTSHAESAWDSPAAVAVVGEAEIDGKRVISRGTSRDWLRGQWRQVAVVPPGLGGEVLVARAGTARLQLTGPAEEMALVREQSAEVTVHVQRAEGVTGEVTLSLLPEKDALPKGVELSLAPIPADADQVTLKLTASKGAAEGAYSFVLQGKLKQGETVEATVTPVIGYRVSAAAK